MVCKWAAIKCHFRERQYASYLRIFRSQRGGILTFPFHRPMESTRVRLLRNSFMILITQVANRRPSIQHTTQVMRPRPMGAGHGHNVVRLLRQSAGTFRAGLSHHVFVHRFLARQVHGTNVRVGHRPVFFKRRFRRRPYVRFQVVVRPLTLLTGTWVLRLFRFVFLVTLLNGLYRLPIGVPRNVIRVSLMTHCQYEDDPPYAFIKQPTLCRPTYDQIRSLRHFPTVNERALLRYFPSGAKGMANYLL